MSTQTTASLPWREAAVELATDLATTLAANAWSLIETREDAFEFVEVASAQQQAAIGHGGTRPRRIDVENEALADEWVHQSRAIQRILPAKTYLYSEEGRRPFLGASKYQFVLQADEFDGTTIAAATASNWSTSVFASYWDHRHGRQRVAGGAIACHSGHVVSWLNRSRLGVVGGPLHGDVWWQRFQRPLDHQVGDLGPVERGPRIEVDELRDGQADYVLFSAAAGSRGRGLYDSDPWVLTDTAFRGTCAGTPSIFAAVRGRVGAIIDPGRATLHDANHLFALACMGWLVLDKETLQPLDLMSLAESSLLPVENEVPRPIPAAIAVRSRESLALIEAARQRTA